MCHMQSKCIFSILQRYSAKSCTPVPKASRPPSSAWMTFHGLNWPFAPLSPPWSITLPTVKPAHSPSIIRSEEHTSELQSLMRISYAVFCLKKKQIYHQRDLKSVTDL